MAADHTTVDAYIAGFLPDVQRLLLSVRSVVLAAAPQAEERISYGMPAVFQAGVVVYYAAFKNHIGLYPPVSDPAIRRQVEKYAGPKGNLRFPYSKPLPLDLIAAVTRARLAANLHARRLQAGGRRHPLVGE